MESVQGRVHHIEYYVNDLSVTREFWGEFLEGLGYREKAVWVEGVSYEHASGTYLVFVEVTGGLKKVRNNRNASGLNHLAFHGGSLRAMAAHRDRVESLGGTVLSAAPDYLCFEDPNGFAVELFGS